MPQYTIESGEMCTSITTPKEADAVALCLLALDRHSRHSTQSTSLGAIIQVTGGRFSGDEVVYLSTESILRRIGRWNEADA